MNLRKIYLLTCIGLRSKKQKITSVNCKYEENKTKRLLNMLLIIYKKNLREPTASRLSSQFHESTYHLIKQLQ